jgi:hypothetical protein
MAHWGSFTVTPANIVGSGFDLDVFADGPIDDSNTHIQILRVQYLLKRPVHAGTLDTTPVRTSADSDDCPAVRTRLAALAEAEAKQMATPPPGGQVLDGTDIGIDAPLLATASGGRMILKNNDGMNAIDDWISTTVEALKPCWKPARGR